MSDPSPVMPSRPARWPRKARAFWPVMFVLVAADCATKELAVGRLSPEYVPHDVAGGILRFTLAYNPGAATGVHFGPYSRVGLSLVAIVAVVALFALYRRVAPWRRLPAAALALLIGGAVGNLIDRLRSPRGVVDFIDIGIGDARFWTFNVADAGLTIGALLLAWLLWRGDVPPHPEEPA